MKRYGNLFSKIIDPQNLYLAHLNARRGKAHYQEVKMVDADPDRYVQDLHDLLLSKSFRTSPYQTKEIFEPKQRTIYKLPYYPDRIVHHAVMQILQPIWDKSFIYDLYSAIPGKGLHAGSYRLRSFMKDRENTKYCLKYDISKFYPSMRHDVLMAIIRQKIKCPSTLWLLDEIVRSPGGDTNVPIGNYLSQYFSNLYLSPLDHWLKEEKHMRYYLRYCDDGVILHQDKQVLQTLLVEIGEYLQGIGLTLNKKTQIFPVDSRGIDYLGYRCFRNYVLLRKSSARNFKRKIRLIEQDHRQMRPDAILSSVMSYAGWLEHCNAHHLIQGYILQNPGLLAICDTAAADLGINNPVQKLILHGKSEKHCLS
jgi:retron-type reverse transcriptase